VLLPVMPPMGGVVLLVTATPQVLIRADCGPWAAAQAGPAASEVALAQDLQLRRTSAARRLLDGGGVGRNGCSSPGR
jgi:hypothetical protein